MTNTALLADKIKISGYKLSFIADYLGLSRYGLYKKMHNESDFIVPEVQKLCEILGLTKSEREKIFFAS